MRKLKPFDMIYRDYTIRVTNIRNYSEPLIRLTRNMYKCKLIIKKDGNNYTTKNIELEAHDKQDLKFQLRLVLNSLNF